MEPPQQLIALCHFDEDWEYVRTLLPSGLEESARKTNALLRCRNVPDAAALVGMALAYAISDLSVKDVAALAGALDVAQRGAGRPAVVPRGLKMKERSQFRRETNGLLGSFGMDGVADVRNE